MRIQAAERLYEEVSGDLFRLFFARTGSEGEAEELVQAAFERFCSALLHAPLKDNSSPKGFVYTIES